jgi:hypothetical protein
VELTRNSNYSNVFPTPISNVDGNSVLVKIVRFFGITNPKVFPYSLLNTQMKTQ